MSPSGEIVMLGSRNGSERLPGGFTGISRHRSQFSTVLGATQSSSAISFTLRVA
jgi:hypothetical protein